MKTNRRIVRIERRNARRAAKANAQLILCRQAGEFHKEYLEVEYAVEEAKLAKLQARIDALQPAQTEVVVTEEEVEVRNIDDAPDIFDEMEAMEA
ncbi:MAG: hypothetical protein J6Q70_06510 [Clostridia bacterium]|nr:hypothetical protein [Clostridia bacterium]